MKNILSLFALAIAVATLIGCNKPSDTMSSTSEINTNSAAATNAVDMTTNTPPR